MLTFFHGDTLHRGMDPDDLVEIWRDRLAEDAEAATWDEDGNEDNDGPPQVMVWGNSIAACATTLLEFALYLEQHPVDEPSRASFVLPPDMQEFRASSLHALIVAPIATRQYIA